MRTLHPYHSRALVITLTELAMAYLLQRTAHWQIKSTVPMPRLSEARCAAPSFGFYGRPINCKMGWAVGLHAISVYTYGV
jgi:hypothetical protein